MADPRQRRLPGDRGRARSSGCVDGYTTTDQYPQAERDSFSDDDQRLGQTSRPGVRTLPTDQINYMRNAVKATVDAYTGKVTLYAWDETDPILQAWRSAFPGTVLDKDQIPADLLPHLRYPEDMFKVQRYQYARYHVTDANDFFQANNQWAGARRTRRAPAAEPDADPDVHAATRQTGQPGLVADCRATCRDNKSNLAGFVAADSDPTSPDYGKITGRGAAQRERAGPDAGLQQPDLRPADHPQDAVVQARRRDDAVRQRGVGAARVRPDVRRTGVCDAAADRRRRRTSPCGT